MPPPRPLRPVPSLPPTKCHMWHATFGTIVPVSALPARHPAGTLPQPLTLPLRLPLPRLPLAGLSVDPSLLVNFAHLARLVSMASGSSSSSSSSSSR